MQNTVAIEKSKLTHTHLPRAVSEIVTIMESSKDEKLRFEAAKWIAERILPRADTVEAGATMQTIALELARAMRDIISQNGGQVVIEGRFKEIEIPPPGESLVLAPDPA